MCRTIDSLSMLIGQFVTGLLSKWQIKEVRKRRITSKSSCSYKNVQVTLPLQIPSSRNRDAFCSKVWYHDAFNCQRPLDSVVWIGEIKYRRVRTSKFLMRLTCRSLPGTLVFFNRCCGPTIRTSLQLNLCWDAGIRTLILRTKIWCGSHYTTSQFLYIVFNKTQVNKRQNLQ